MISGILLTVGSIGCMCASGVAMSALVSFLHNYELPTLKNGKRDSSNSRNRDRIDRLSDRVSRPHDLM